MGGPWWLGGERGWDFSIARYGKKGGMVKGKGKGERKGG